jgi:hypothetical protein
MSFTFSDTDFITINDSASPPTIATPYPSPINVIGLTDLVVMKVTVTLQGFTHGFPADVGALLVGPQGQYSLLFAAVGGTARYSVTNLTLTIDDEATNSLPVYAALTSGTYKPTNGYLAFGNPGLPYNFPAPAPNGTSNAVSALSVFKNTDPTGSWNLFVVDNVEGDAGDISGGWTLNLSVAVPLQVAQIKTNVVISWPASAQRVSLQSAPSLTNPNGWTNVGSVPLATSGRYAVTNSIVGASLFYRLVGP